MGNIGGAFNRHSFPEHDPKFWEDLNVFIDALEERILIENLQYNRNKSEKTMNKFQENLVWSKE